MDTSVTQSPKTKRRIAVLSSSRADYGLLYHLCGSIDESESLELYFYVTGSHLVDHQGNTIHRIQEDGLPIHAMFSLGEMQDHPVGMAETQSRMIQQLTRQLVMDEIELLVLLGDRYEILAAANAATISRVPIAHLCGGDVTEGAFDDAIRHAISKLSHLHFTTHQQASRRLIQLGECSDRVFNVGSPGLDHLHEFKPLTPQELVSRTGLPLAEQNIMLVFHPETLALGKEEEHLEVLLDVLNELHGINIYISGSNADPMGQKYNQAFQEYSKQHAAHCCFFHSLGTQAYWTLLGQMDALLGNSSSGLYEAPSLHCPTVNLGDRQKGRPAAESVLHSAIHKDEILRTIEQSMRLKKEFDWSKLNNPYGNGHSSTRIYQILVGFQSYHQLLKKRFADT